MVRKRREKRGEKETTFFQDCRRPRARGSMEYLKKETAFWADLDVLRALEGSVDRETPRRRGEAGDEHQRERARAQALLRALSFQLYSP